MKQYINKAAVKAEIEKRIASLESIGSENYLHDNYPEQYAMLVTLKSLKFSLDTLEVKDDVVSNEPIISPELLTASAAYAREQLANPDYPTYNDEYELLCAFEAGAKWQEEQFEKNRIEHCHSITEEQYNLETSFVEGHIKKYHRIPTILDAIEYGMSLKKGE